MKKVFLIVAALFTVCSCDFSSIFNRFVNGNGIPVDVPVSVADFNSISSVGSIDVYYTQAPGAPSVVLTCDENTADYYEVTVSQGVLKVAVKTGYVVVPKTKSYVTVSSPTLKEVKLTGSGDCYVSGNLAVDDDLDFTITGSGDLECSSVDCRSFQAKLTGSGNAQINQLAANIALLSSLGSGDISVGSVSASSVILACSGSGDANLGCDNVGKIEVTITGSGNVTLTGRAHELKKKVTGSGRVNIKGLELPDGD